MSKRSRIILLSCITVLCCVALIVGGTFALFTYKREVTNHLQAGELKAILTRTKLQATTLGDDGQLKTATNAEPKDFTQQNTDNIFGLKTQETVAPGCSFTATLTLQNQGTVAFVYWVEVSGITGDKELQDQLQFTVSVTDGDSKSELLSSDQIGTVMGNATAPIGTILRGASAEFTVTLTFVDTSANNTAQAKTASFDLIVHAQQVTAA